jgi:hypothetical protein
MLTPATTVLMQGVALSMTPPTTLGQLRDGTRLRPKGLSMGLGSKLVRPSRMTQYIGNRSPICSSEGRQPAVGLTPLSL